MRVEKGILEYYHGGNASCGDGGYFSRSWDIQVDNTMKIHLIEEFINVESLSEMYDRKDKKASIILEKFFVDGLGKALNGSNLLTLYLGRYQPTNWMTKKFESKIDICGVYK